MTLFAAASLGLSVASTVAGFAADKNRADAERAFQDYQNQMVRLSSLEDQNTISLNAERARRIAEESIITVQANSIRAQGAAAVAAGVAGVQGASVQLTAVGIARNAARNESIIREDFKLQLVDIDQQRKTAARRATAGLDTSVISDPSGVSLLTSVGQSAIRIGRELGAI